MCQRANTANSIWLSACILAAVFGATGCRLPDRQPGRYFFVNLKAEVAPNAPPARTYFLLQGGGEADFTTIRGQKLRPVVVEALRQKGFVEVANMAEAEISIFVFAASEVTKTSVAYERPNVAYIPGGMSTVNTTTFGALGAVQSQSLVSTPGQFMVAGSTQHTYEKYGRRGGVCIIACAWKEWQLSGARPGTQPRVLWQSEVTFHGDAPFGDLLHACMPLALRHAATAFERVWVYDDPERFLTEPLP